MRPRLLDLFCGAGGAAMGYHRAGFEVVGVDIKPQPNYPFEFRQADALTFPLDGFDAIHASPPCQAYSTLRVMANASEHPDLVGPTRDLLRATGLPYVIENVVGAPLINAVEVCGASLGLSADGYELARHRLFECSFPVMVSPCSHGAREVIGFYGDHARRPQRTVAGVRNRAGTDITASVAKLSLVRDLMGIDWMAWEEATQAIPPAYTEHIGQYLLAAVTRAVA